MFKIFILFIIFALCFIVLLICLEIFLAKQGVVPPFQNPSRKAITFGTGFPITYVVMGDSLAAGQGALYQKGIAIQTARYLSQKKQVTLINTGVSGATAADVLHDQTYILDTITPDIVLLVVGANDVIHLTTLETIQTAVTGIIRKILAKNCQAKIILTGAPDMGTIPRFYAPLAWIASRQSQRVNAIFETIIAQNQLTYAPIFEETGPIFLRDRTLYSVDRFHPNERGYAIWNTVLETAISAAADQPSHCAK